MVRRHGVITGSGVQGTGEESDLHGQGEEEEVFLRRAHLSRGSRGQIFCLVSTGWGDDEGEWWMVDGVSFLLSTPGCTCTQRNPLNLR